jgi:hypothetical protein
MTEKTTDHTMDTLNKTIKKLSQEEYQQLIQLVSGGRHNKPFKVLEAARHHQKTDSEMMQELEVSPSAYYTLKSRLNDKIASLFARNTKSPVNILMDEVTRVPAQLYGTNREFAIRALTDLEKQLLEYDLSSELIIVYKTLAQLNLYTEDYSHYMKLHDKHVAYSLAVSKAETLFYRFIHQLGTYLINRSEKDFDDLVMMKRELSNISEMYDSHRLYIYYNLANIYYQCSLPEKKEGLKAKESELAESIKKMENIFEKYNQDTFYQNIRFIVPYLYFAVYQQTGNQLLADMHYQQLKVSLPEISNKHFHNYILIHMLNTKVGKYLADRNESVLAELNSLLQSKVEIDINEAFHQISFSKFIAITHFYRKEYTEAAKVINKLRNNFPLKKYPIADVECRLFQALQYCILGEDGLCNQIIASLRRQLADEEQEWTGAFTFMKMLKNALKAVDLRKKIKRVQGLWDQFQQENKGKHAILPFVRLDDSTIRKMCNPIKG